MLPLLGKFFSSRHISTSFRFNGQRCALRKNRSYHQSLIHWRLDQHRAFVSTHNPLSCPFPNERISRSIATLPSRRTLSLNAELSMDDKPEKSIEEQYSKKSPLEHVLLRPGMYVGPAERLPPTQCWTLDPVPPPYNFESSSSANAPTSPTKLDYRMKSQELALVPALNKIFDEILVNASDNRLRNPKTCTKLEVAIDPGTHERDPQIRIWNNGKGIPIQVHKAENMHVPEMLFGHLLTGSNFDDDEKRVTGTLTCGH